MISFWKIALIAPLSACAVVASAADPVAAVSGAAKDVAPKAADAKDVGDVLAKFEARGAEAMNRGQYSLAKELFGKAIDRAKEAGDAAKVAALQEKVRACEKQIKELAAVMPVPPSDLPNEPTVETRPDKRKKHVAPADGKPMDIVMKELGNFEYDSDKGGNIPEDVRKLHGVTVRVQGFMIPLDQADNISHFSLVPSLFACCVGQPPQVHHQIVVHTPKGKAVSYFPDEIVCEGTLKVQERKEDGYIVSVFEMDVASVKPAAK